MGSMEGDNRINATSSRQKAPPNTAPHLQEEIAMLLSQWNGLQMAVENRWGGHDSLQKSQQLASDIFSWFTQSKAKLHIEDLENLLHENMLLSFNTEIEDGSIEEYDYEMFDEMQQIAEQLMVMHEEYVHEND